MCARIGSAAGRLGTAVEYLNGNPLEDGRTPSLTEQMRLPVHGLPDECTRRSKKKNELARWLGFSICRVSLVRL